LTHGTAKLVRQTPKALLLLWGVELEGVHLRLRFSTQNQSQKTKQRGKKNCLYGQTRWIHSGLH
jgi:hypothetical protein